MQFTRGAKPGAEGGAWASSRLVTSGGAATTATHCPYCALQCGIRIDRTEPDAPTLIGDPSFPVNRGRLCVKGFTALDAVAHPDRLLGPLAKGQSGSLEPVSWDAALNGIALRILSLQERWGRDAIGVFGSGALTNEKAYLLGKFARVALRTSQIDYNGRFCMSSAAAAANHAFGLDRGLPFPLTDLAKAEVLLLAGGNPAETMPPLMGYFDAQRAAGGRLIVVDPRRTATAEMATDHLAIRPGTDAALAHGLVHLLIRERLVDTAYVESRTEGFERLRAMVAGYWPSRVERITGVAEGTLIELAQLIGRARSVMVLTGRGPEQQTQGVANAGAYINVALAVGAVGRAGSGYGCLTGQGNGQGGREHGQKADQLPGYRDIRDPLARRHVAAVWGIAEEELPGAGVSAQEMFASAGTIGGILGLLVFGANPLVSAPDAAALERSLRRLELLVVTDFFLSETARLADFVLPAAQWLEEDGTMTNLEGRVIRRRRALPPPPGVKTDIEIIAALAERLGVGERFSFEDSERVFDELRRATAGGRADYSGITYTRIDREEGVFWPAPATLPAVCEASSSLAAGTAEVSPGGSPLFSDRFFTPTGRARFMTSAHRDPAEVPDGEYPLFLTTGRLQGHYQTRSQTRRVPRLEQLAPRPLVQIHPTTAERFGIRSGEEVTLSTRRGSARFAADVTPAVRTDTVFLPFHWGGEQAANRLTNAALDPVSRMPEFKVCAVRIEKAHPMEAK